MKRHRFPDGPGFLSRSGLAEYLDVSPDTVSRMVEAGELPRPIKVRGMDRWRRAEVDEWLCPQGIAPNPGGPVHCDAVFTRG